MSYLVQLRSFLDVYRAGSISKAANRLGLSQPAVSSHIHSLEALTGYILFTRRSHGVVPTVEASELARQIGDNLDVIETTLTLMRGRSKKIAGIVTIIGPAELLWAKSTRMFSSKIPDELRFKILTGDRQRIYSSLNNGESDLAITTSKPDERKFGFKVIGKEKLIIVASSSMAQEFTGKEVTADLLENLPLIAYDDQLPLVRKMFKNVYNRETKILPSIIVPDLRIIEKMISENHYWSVMPEYLCQDGIKKGKMMHIHHAGDFPENDIYLVWNESGLRHNRVMFFKEYILRISDEGIFFSDI